MNSNYFNVSLDDPDSAFLVGTKISSFGGPEDVKSGQDNGQFAFGGSSVDESGQESKLNFAAIDPAWYKNGIKPGSTVDVINPKTGDRVPVVLTDKGPARWTGRGIDVAPHVLNQLGLDTDETAYIDFKPAVTNPPSAQPMQDTGQDSGQEDLTTKQGADQYLQRMTAPGQPMQAANTPASGVRSDITSTSDEALSGIKKLPDGGYDLGDGVIGYPNGVFSVQSGNVITQRIPDPNSPSGYKIHTQNVKPIDQPVPPIPEGMPPEEALKQLSQADQIKAQMFANYELPATSQYGRMNPDFARLIPYAKAINPDLDPSKYLIQRQAKLQYYSQANNTPGAAISATNQAIKHLGTLIDINNQLGGSNFPDVQGVENFLKQKGGQTAVNDFNIVRTTLATEIARALQKGVPTLDQVREWEHNIDASLGDAQRRSALLRDIPAVLSGQLETMDKGWKKSMGKDLPVNDLIDETSQGVLRDKLGFKEYAGRKLTNAVNPVSAPPKPAPVIGKIYTDAQGNKARYTGDPASPWQAIQ